MLITPLLFKLDKIKANDINVLWNNYEISAKLIAEIYNVINKKCISMSFILCSMTILARRTFVLAFSRTTNLPEFRCTMLEPAL